MKPADRIRIIDELTATIRGRMMDNVAKVPPNWDGIELRWWLKSIVDESPPSTSAYRERFREFLDDLENLGL